MKNAGGFESGSCKLENRAVIEVMIDSFFLRSTSTSGGIDELEPMLMKVELRITCDQMS